MLFVILYYMLFLFKYNIYFIMYIVYLYCILYTTVSRQGTPYQSMGQFFCYCAGKFPPHSAIPRFLLRGPGPSGRGKERKRVERLRKFLSF